MPLSKSYNYDPDHVFDLMIIGSGMAGMAAAAFAVNRRLSTVQAGGAGGTIFASGLLDLLGVYPSDQKKIWDNPWEAISCLRNDGSKHPYSRIRDMDIANAFEEIIAFLNASGISYRSQKNLNSRVITSMGTVRPAYYVPESMWHGVEAYREKAPCLIVDFQGLREFSACQISESFKKEWPAVRSKRVVFPETEELNEVHALHLARALELSKTREALAGRIKPYIHEARYVGFPAIFGIKRTREILSHLSNMLGVRVFEIPMMPASVPGFRLKEIFDSSLTQKGMLRLIDKRVRSVSRSSNGNFLLEIGEGTAMQTIKVRGIILASGRFIGRGLVAGREGVYEPLLGIPLYQPENRASWHHEDFMSPGGHPVNRAGIEVDNSFRPVDGSGALLYDNVFIAGSILAHQDWMRMKCGSGMSIATAYAAVLSYIDNCMKIPDRTFSR